MGSTPNFTHHKSRKQVRYLCQKPVRKLGDICPERLKYLVNKRSRDLLDLSIKLISLDIQLHNAGMLREKPIQEAKQW